MPTILDAGTVQLSNADVLQWVRAKREQHRREDAADEAAGRPKTKRPSKFMNSLRKHERELTDKKYAYAANPGAYEGTQRGKAIKLFIERCDEAICYPLESQYSSKGISMKQLKATLGKVYEKKTFTTSELMMIQNLAPENVSMLEMVVEGWEHRFSVDEMEKILQVINEVFRCGDKLPELEADAKVS
ncbi:hypothetical protein AMS68_003170 [Peltaster fructicola]|uniref:DNA-directed RNA polymerase III subunit RPC9 n=1 Tax=Peltaster fructicola TaxID=286661 RepID=A0A6H0XSG0_9PEZI|nr:hypothetical protein AMS68_003170 [Peltaster fructicola]